MAAPLTTSSNFAPAVRSDLFKDLLLRTTPEMHYAKVAKKAAKAGKSGDTLVFRRIEALSLATTPLVEGVAPNGQRLTKTDVSAVLAQYGDYVPLTDYVQAIMDHPILMNANEVLSEQLAQTHDKLSGDKFATGTSVLYGGTAASRTDLLDTTHIVSTTLLAKAVRTLQGNNAKMFTKEIGATDKVATAPVRPAFWAVTTEDVAYDLENLTGWIPSTNYASSMQAMPGEIGSYRNIRFLVSTQAIKFLGGGGTASGTQATSTLADVHTILVFGKEAVAEVPLSGKSAENIIHLPGSAGPADPLNQYGTSGWKSTRTQVILNDNYFIRLEVAVSS